MKTRSLLLACAFLFGPAAFAQQEVNAVDALKTLDAWLTENVDDTAFDLLGLDRARTHQFLTQLEPRFQGTYVYDLASSGETARQVLPLLKEFEETAPLADWLETHLDYFEVAEKLKKEAPKNSTPGRGPSPETQRRAWITVLESRPVPAGANPRLARLREIFASEHVPSQLVWLAEVESSFNPRARSPVGAAGLFQLMPATARSLDLSVNLLRDDRLNEEKNSRAAARYLHHLHERFHDWRLALAAYNAGEGRVSDLLAKNKVRTFDAIAGRLPAETQMYVPKIEATLRRREHCALADLR